jgi:hypothetical protein
VEGDRQRELQTVDQYMVVHTVRRAGATLPLDHDLGGRLGVTAVGHELDGDAHVRLAAGDVRSQRPRVARCEQHFATPPRQLPDAISGVVLVMGLLLH